VPSNGPVKRFMTTFPKVVRLDVPVAEARAFMVEHGIRHLPVVEDGALVGVVSERDLRVLAAPSSDRPICVADVFTRDPLTVDLETPLDRVTEAMAQRRVGSAIVVREQRVVGILTTTDVCRLLSEFLRESPPADDDVA
jgi:acetoin utilization protein AcuB